MTAADVAYRPHLHPAYTTAVRSLRVASLTALTPEINHYRLVSDDDSTLTAYQPGSHLIVTAGQHRNAYSLVDDGVLPGSYGISVMRRGEGRGSDWIHDQLKAGDLLQVEGPRSMFPPILNQRNALLVAGGIGVTPILSHARAIARQGGSADIIYSYRPGHAAHLDDLRQVVEFPGVTLHEVVTVEDTISMILERFRVQPLEMHTRVRLRPASAPRHLPASRSSGRMALRACASRAVYRTRSRLGRPVHCRCGQFRGDHRRTGRDVLTSAATRPWPTGAQLVPPRRLRRMPHLCHCRNRRAPRLRPHGRGEIHQHHHAVLRVSRPGHHRGRSMNARVLNHTGAVEAYLTQPVDHLSNLPWPFPENDTTFEYAVNVEPARVPCVTHGGEWGRHLVDLGGAEYPTIMAERRRILDADPHRVKIMPGMELACWDLLLYYLRDLDLSYPQIMHLTDEPGGQFHWRNTILGTDQRFSFGDWNTLPHGPLDFLAREIPDDLLLVIERDGRLYFDAGAVTFAAAWSVSFDVGMDMYEIHTPVPHLIRTGVVNRAEQFLRQLRADEAYRRVNWTLSTSDSHKLDVSLEELPEWGRDIPRMVRERDYGRARLRIELEHFVRLPMTGAVTFNIRTFMASLRDVRRIPAWSTQLATVIDTLDEQIAAYKGGSSAVSVGARRSAGHGFGWVNADLGRACYGRTPHASRALRVASRWPLATLDPRASMRPPGRRKGRSQTCPGHWRGPENKPVRASKATHGNVSRSTRDSSTTAMTLFPIYAVSNHITVEENKIDGCTD